MDRTRSPFPLAKLVRHKGGVLLWTGALTLALGFVLVDGALRLRQVRGATEQDISGLPSPQGDPASPSGYAWNQHRLILPGLGMDGYHWILHTERMLAGEGPRIRVSPHDNAPGGREVHWAGPLRWWTGGLARAGALVRRDPSPSGALERVAPWANTALLALLLVALTPLVARRFGPAAAALFALGSVSVYPYYEYWVVGYLDHHGLATLSAAMAVLFLAAGGAGWVQAEGADAARLPPADRALRRWLPDSTQARRWFVASAAAAAAGLWISAATVVPVMLGAGAAALVGTAVAGESSRERPWRVEPGLWRLWGIAGAAGSVLFYLLEYFPAHLGMRLEVNHPLYAVAWLGAGDLLCRVARRRREPLRSGRSAARGTEAHGRRADGAWMLLDLGVVLLLPSVILLTRDTTFRLADPFLWALHRNHIVEFLGLGSHLARMGTSEIVAGVSALPLLGPILAVLLWPADLEGPGRWVWRGVLLLSVAAGAAYASVVAFGASGDAGVGALAVGLVLGTSVLLRRSRSAAPLAAPWRAALALPLLPALLLLALAFDQVRWLGIACGLWLVVLVVVTTAVGEAGPGSPWTVSRRTATAALIALVLLPFPFFTVRTALQARGSAGIPRDMLTQLATREVSQWLRARVGDEPAVVLTGPNSTTLMAFFGGFPGLGTLYWENLEGLAATAEIYSAPSPERVHELLLRRGVTHLVSYPWEPGLFAYASGGGPPGRPDLQAAPRDAFLPRLLEQMRSAGPGPGALPPWLVPLSYDLPTAELLGGGRVHVLEVVPPQPAELAHARLARYHHALGEHEKAEEALLASLRVRPNLAALALLARIQYVREDAAGLAATLGEVRRLLPEAATLTPGDRVDLAVALALVRDLEEARRQLDAVLSAVGERELRRLSPEALSFLIGLARQLGLAASHERTLALAVELLPLPAQEEFR